ncbi:hypothetical protein GCM10011609_85850 [Lentzea pudingi]|uniref:Uncharacterized protein n=1 Tax=Lentzea pudingi TaxID=1789439 RepID=A0ABQ2IW31_9PSEU|nr:hypothetical protein GCM10011609_85850 [Lentzea pudingi]
MPSRVDDRILHNVVGQVEEHDVNVSELTDVSAVFGPRAACQPAGGGSYQVVMAVA